MLDILFSHSYYYKLDSKQWENKTPYPPLGTLYAASKMRSAGYSVGLFDTNLKDNPFGIEEMIDKENPKYLVIYDDGFNYLTKMCLTNMREAAFKMIGLAKERNCTVIVCSSDSTDHFDLYLNAGADFIIKGEAELTLEELISSLEDGKEFKQLLGIVFREDDQTKINSKRPVLQDLDLLGQPAWDLVDIDSYRSVWKEGGRKLSLNIATTRGCPYKCNWCAKPIYGNRYNAHSPQFIVDQIKLLQSKFGVSDFWMCDDIFGLKPKWVQEFNKLLKQEGLSISYQIQSRVDLLLKDDTIDALVQSGLKEVWVGAESGSQKILDAMDKGTDVDQIYEATKLLKSKGVRVCFFLQFGYIGEKWEDIQKTIGMVLELIPDNIGISVSYPLPGTKFFEMVKSQLDEKANWTDSDDLDLMFENTFGPKFYKTLHRYVHNRYRIKKGLNGLTQVLTPSVYPFSKKIKDIARMIYHMPMSIINRTLLKKFSIK
jgi:anaerobic magnesium-protoporphyrin IX monomethyl ester cyclase